MSASLNYDDWLDRVSWKMHQAVSLVLGIDPIDSMIENPNKVMTGISNVAKRERWRRLYEDTKSAIGHKDLESVPPSVGNLWPNCQIKPAKYLTWAKSRKLDLPAPLWLWLDGIAPTEPVANPELKKVSDGGTVNDKIIPGKLPRTAVGKLAIKAAWELECASKRAASRDDVMTCLQKWADTGAEPDVLLKSNKQKRGVEWRTRDGRDKLYDANACGKALVAWGKSRA